MSILTVISGIIVVLAFLAAGLAKITKQGQMVEAADRLAFSTTQFQLIGVAESAGALGVLAGLLSNDFDALGIAAATGLVLVGFGATASHLKAGDDPKDAAGGAVLAVLAIVHIIGTAVA